MVSDPAWLGILAVVCASALMVLRRAFVVYIGLKLPLGLSRDAHVPAVCVAVCISLIAILGLARVPTDWRSAVTKSIFGLFGLTLVVVPLTAALALSK